MRERPILFNDAMVRAILSGAKTQTRRPVKPQPSVFVPGPNRHAPKHEAAYLDAYCSKLKTEQNPRGMSDRWCWWTPDNRQGPDWIRCPFGVPGDFLWVRECFAQLDGRYSVVPLSYRADRDGAESRDGFWKWTPSIHMPRWASRLTLRVTDVRVERVRDITEEDARAEGVIPVPFCRAGRGDGFEHVESFEETWRDTYGPESWTANPWVWVLSFEREEAGHG